MKNYIPRSHPAARWVAVLLSFSLLGLAFVAARELWTKRTGTQLESWLVPVFEIIGRATYEDWMLYAGIFALLLGLVLVAIGIKPRRKTHRAVASAANIWIRDVDIARQCTATAEKVPGVRRASTYVTRTTVTVTITCSSHDDDVTERVSASITPLIAELATVPQLVLRTSPRNGEDR
ncbi:DUF6286 domain-containing protein [Corynebacterium sp. H128]|uniref:DUF6286 domain-containing protein n=1 Tax=unclassified Corynebacterium TaxID=2624378 RepID=UPI0030A760B8